MFNEARFLTLHNATGVIRRETYNSREYVVVPVVALVEGVIHAVNAPSPELVRASEFAACDDWEGMPVHAGHPMKNGVPVSGRLPDILPLALGIVRNPSADSQKLCMEAWLDIEACSKSDKGQRILANVTATPPKMIEVSVGVFVSMKHAEGIFKGKRYAGEWQNLRKDHLALLDEGHTGACSIEMGCGTPRVAMRVADNGELEVLLGDGSNQHQIRYTGVGGTYEVRTEDMMHVVYHEGKRVSMHARESHAHLHAEARAQGAQMKSLSARIMEFFRSAMPKGWSDTEVRKELKEGLEALEPKMRNSGFIESWTDNRVVYCIYPEQYDGPMEYYARSYKFADNDVTFGDREEVEPVMTYPTIAEEQPVTTPVIVPDMQETTTPPCSCGNHAARAAEDIDMNKTERIAALVANPHSPVKNQKALELMTDEELTTLEANATSLKTAAEKATADKAALDKAQSDLEKSQKDLKAAQDALAAPVTEDRLPQEYRDLAAREKARVEAEKTALITSIRAASEVFTEDQLKAKSNDELKQLDEFVKSQKPQQQRAAVDYSLQGVPRTAGSEDKDRYKVKNPWGDIDKRAGNAETAEKAH